MAKKITQKKLEAMAAELLDTPFKELSERKQRIITMIAQGELVSSDSNRTYHEQMTLGERFSDKVAQFGGSWPFILVALMFLGFWMYINVTDKVLHSPFDPYPFILLNLALSMLAALQAPIIMMSQNRRAAKDRIEANANYEVSLKMELEIRGLHKRIKELDQKCSLMMRKHEKELPPFSDHD